MESSKITVAETGNKRAAITDEDVAQAINDLSQWLKTNVPEYAAANLKEGTDASGLSTHKHLQILLSKHNGGIHFEDTYQGLSLQQI
jgi:hypothetical protein